MFETVAFPIDLYTYKLRHVLGSSGLATTGRSRTAAAPPTPDAQTQIFVYLESSRVEDIEKFQL